MSQPKVKAVDSDAPTREEEQPEPITFTLVVVSPSVGVSGPLTFPHLPALTSVQDLKAKIRDALPSKPADDNQRLIHRGRMLARENETMVDIFGRETLANPEPQTLHLVLRPTGQEPRPNIASPTPVLGPQHVAPPFAAPAQNRPQSTPINPNPGMTTQLPLPGFQQVAQHQILHQADHLQNLMAQRLQHLQQETVRLQQDMLSIEQRSRAIAAGNTGLFQPPQQPAPSQATFAPGLQNAFQMPHQPFRGPPMPASVQNLINQQQRDRANEGRQGAQDTGTSTNGAGIPRQTTSGTASPILHRPDHTSTHTREGVGPNGERWQITVNETTTTFPAAQPAHPHHHQQHHGYVNNPVLDNLQAILRNADRGLAAQNPQNNAEQANNAARASSSPLTAASHDESTPQPLSEPTVGVATPATTNSSPSSSVLLNRTPTAQAPRINAGVQASTSTNLLSRMDPMVYILSSPQGPRALLLNNSETFYTPRQSSRRRRHDSPAPAPGAAPHILQGLPEFRNRNPDRRRARPDRNDNARIQNQNHLEPVAGQAHANPGPGALAAQIGPMIWLVIRLAGFVWFFTAGNSSWTRLFMVTAMAVGVFIINTGIFNGIAEQLWGPIRRHVETLIPLAGPEAARIPAVNAAIPRQPVADTPAENQQARRRRPGELDEAEVAARLIEQHRQANGGWVMAQIRRAEHAALLFLASLVPGVGERHIAAREAEASAAEAERQRAINAAAAENAGNAGTVESAIGEQATTEGANTGQGSERRTQNTDDEAPPVQPVVGT